MNAHKCAYARITEKRRHSACVTMNDVGEPHGHESVRCLGTMCAESRATGVNVTGGSARPVRAWRDGRDRPGSCPQATTVERVA